MSNIQTQWAKEGSAITGNLILTQLPAQKSAAPWRVTKERQSLELRQKDGLETAVSRDPSHNQPSNADTIAYTSKILLKGP
jgi:hypothetical protein